jgi:hypothetical protein
MRHVKKFSGMALSLFASILMINPGQAQTSSKDQKVVADAKTAKSDFIRVDGQMKSLFDNAYGYVIFQMWAKVQLVLEVQQVMVRFFKKAH